jgi:hypothetical protein
VALIGAADTSLLLSYEPPFDPTVIFIIRPIINFLEALWFLFIIHIPRRDEELILTNRLRFETPVNTIAVTEELLVSAYVVVCVGNLAVLEGLCLGFLGVGEVHHLLGRNSFRNLWTPY